MNRLFLCFPGKVPNTITWGKNYLRKIPCFANLCLKWMTLQRRRIGTSIVEEIYHPGKRMSDPFDSILFPTPPFL